MAFVFYRPTQEIISQKILDDYDQQSYFCYVYNKLNACKMSEKDYKEEQKALRLTTQKATKSKKSALNYLKRSGIYDIMQASEKLETKKPSARTHR